MFSYALFMCTLYTLCRRIIKFDVVEEMRVSWGQRSVTPPIPILGFSCFNAERPNLAHKEGRRPFMSATPLRVHKCVARFVSDIRVCFLSRRRSTHHKRPVSHRSTRYACSGANPVTDQFTISRRDCNGNTHEDCGRHSTVYWVIL